MISARNYLFLLLLFILPTQTIISQVNADSLLLEIGKQNNIIESFTADVAIEVDVDFIRIPVKKGKVYYQSPNQFKFKASGFVLLPKKGFNYSINEIIDSNNMALYAGIDSLGTKIKIVPMDETAGFVLATAWIDPLKTRINQLEISSLDQGKITMHLEYNDLPFNLPIKTTLSFDIKQLDIPMKFMGNASVDRSKMKGEKTSGKVILNYSNYEINNQISPSVFTDEEINSTPHDIYYLD